MIVARRTFLIGLASVLASPAIAKGSLFLGEIATGTLPSPLKWRAVGDITMSSMPTGEEIAAHSFREEPVRWTIFRGEDSVYNVMMNPRATMRWVAAQDSEIVVPEHSVLRVVVEPCHTWTSIHIVSDIETNKHPLTRRRKFAETYRWTDGKPELDSVAALDPLDASVLTG